MGLGTREIISCAALDMFFFFFVVSTIKSTAFILFYAVPQAYRRVPRRNSTVGDPPTSVCRCHGDAMGRKTVRTGRTRRTAHPVSLSACLKSGCDGEGTKTRTDGRHQRDVQAGDIKAQQGALHIITDVWREVWVEKSRLASSFLFPDITSIWPSLFPTSGN